MQFNFIYPMIFGPTEIGAKTGRKIIAERRIGRPE
jgi:hypothetical protein